MSPPALPFSEKLRTSLSSSRTASVFHVSRSTGLWEKRAKCRWLPKAAPAGLNCLYHPPLLLISLRRPGPWGGLPLVSKGCGRGISGACEGSPELQGVVGTVPAAYCRRQCPLSPRRNLVEEVNATYMKTCLYHKISHPLCPVFNLGYVAQQSGQNFSTLAEKVLFQASGEG